MTNAVAPRSTHLDGLSSIGSKVFARDPIGFEEALFVLKIEGEYIFDLFALTNRVRRFYVGDEISLCAIINARSGRCSEDCAFCSQSAHASSRIENFDLIETGKALDGARAALAAGAGKYGIVTSGYGFSGGSKKDRIGLDKVLDYIRAIKDGAPIHRCVSLGIIDYERALELKEAGVMEYHHNLETAESFFAQICSTHSYQEDVDTIKAVKRAGLRACAGGIFGLGETDEHRVELAMKLRELDVDSVPINILNPIAGTRLENATPLKPFTILKIIAMFRLVMPDKDIKVAGGRERNLRDLQSLIFAAGANSTMIGSYLTTQGRPAEDDLRMIEDLELSVREESC